VQSAKTASLTQEHLEEHIAGLRDEITQLDEKADATKYETESQVLQLTQRGAELQEDLEKTRKAHQEEINLFQEASAMELKSEQERLKASAGRKIEVQAQELRELQDQLTAEKAESQKKAAEVASLQKEIEAFDPMAYALKKQAAEEEAELLVYRQQFEAAQRSSCVEPAPQAIPIRPSPSKPDPCWRGHDGSTTCFKGVQTTQPTSEAKPGAKIDRFLLATDDSPTEAESVPKTFQRIHSQSKTIPMEEQQEKQTQPAQSMQESEEPPIQEQGAAQPLSEPETPPMEDQQENAQADLQGAAQETQPPLTVDEDGAETAISWSLPDGSWCHIPECNGCGESNEGAPVFYKSLQEARGIVALSWQSIIFKHQSLQLICSNPSRTCFPNCSIGMCRHGAAHFLICLFPPPPSRLRKGGGIAQKLFPGGGDPI
jgi:hypothetical protein